MAFFVRMAPEAPGDPVLEESIEHRLHERVENRESQGASRKEKVTHMANSPLSQCVER